MLNMKKILILLIVFSMILGTVFTVNASDLNDKYSVSVEKMKALGLLPENVDLSDPDALITRADFLTIAIKFMGYENMLPSSVDQDLFKDVDRDHENAEVIALGVQLGLLTGYSDGYFYPDQPIAFNQAIKVLLTSLGYDVKADNVGGYTAGYLSVANEIKLLKGVSIVNDKLSNSTLFKLLENAVDIDVVVQTSAGKEAVYKKSGKLLEVRHDIYKVEGVVNATNITSLLGYSTTNTDKVTIGNVLMSEGDQKSIENYLGYAVSAYYKKTDDDSTGSLIYYSVDEDNVVINVESDDIKKDDSSFSAFNFVYYDELTEENDNVLISGDCNVIINGKLKTLYSKDDLAPDYGQISLIDNNNDGEFDVINIFRATRIMSIDSITTEGDKVIFFDKLNNTNPVTIDQKSKSEHYSIIKNNQPAVISDIVKFDVMVIGESEDGSNKLIYVSNNAVEGTITATDSDNNVIVGDKSYELSQQYVALSEGETKIDFAKKLEIGMKAILYLDYKGNVQASSISDSDTLKYGYLLKIDTVDNNKFRKIDDYYQIKMLTQDNELKTFNLPEKLMFNENLKKDAEVLTALSAGGLATDSGKGSGIRQLIKYTANDKDMITTLYSVQQDGNLEFGGTFISTDFYNYYQSTWFREFYRDANTTVFYIYDDENQCEAVHSYEPIQGGKYTIHFYDVDDVLVAGAAIQYFTGEASANGADITAEQPLIMVDSIINAINEEGLPDKCIKGITVDGAERRIFVGERTKQGVADLFKTVKPGDVILCQTDNKGQLNGMIKVYDVTKPDIYGSSSNSLSPQGAVDYYSVHQLRSTVYGVVKNKIDSNILYWFEKDANGKEKVRRQSISGSPVACLDLTGAKPVIKTGWSANNIKPGDKIIWTARSNTTKAVIIVRN